MKLMNKQTIEFTALTNGIGLIMFVASMCSVSHAATMDEYVTCSLVYGGLFQAAKNAQHDGMLSYSRPRLQAVLPYMQENRENPRAKEKLREIASRLENEVKTVFVKQATDAILGKDTEKLKVAMSRVFLCDKAFGLVSLPLPVQDEQPPRWNQFLQGFHAGCIAKQRGAASPFSDPQILNYCQCMTDKAAARGVGVNSSAETTERVINESHGACFGSIH